MGKPPNLYSDKIAPVHRASPEEVFFVRFETVPTPTSSEFGKLGGAFVNCYVDADDLRTAEARAVEFLRQNGWQPRRFEAWKLTQTDHTGNFSSEEISDSAYVLVRREEVADIACTFFCWLLHVPEGDETEAQTAG